MPGSLQKERPQAFGIKGGHRRGGLHVRGLLSQHQSHKAALQRQSSTMPGSALLCCLLLLAEVGASRGHNTQEGNNCTHFPVSQTYTLRELRAAFDQVKTFFVSMPPACLSSWDGLKSMELWK